MAKVLIALSGGLDSAVLAGALIDAGHEVHAVNFLYGSKHSPYEVAAAKNLATHYGIPIHQIHIENFMNGMDSALLSKDSRSIPEGHYAEESMKLTVVPGRNTIFVSILMGLAQSWDMRLVGLGIHAGDHAIYPDCRPDWFGAMQAVFDVATERKVALGAPFIQMNKAEIVKLGLQLKVPFELTRTCYKAQAVACGECGSCRERLEAFEINDLPDLIDYEV